jgi:2-methylcitrate dehydratase PrpD
MAGLTRSLAERSCAMTFDELPGDVVEQCRHCLLDWFGVTLAASHEDATTILLEALGAPAEGAATVVGHSLRCRPLDAALVNGTASHALDYDDFNHAFLGHASVAVLGAALALAEELDATVADLFAAFAAGYETACRVAVAMGPEPYRRGFHQTGTAGTFGAAAATAHLLELDADATATAFGLAASQAAGGAFNFGTMAKPLHAGKACQNGLLAALLASKGFTANAEAIEAERGFAALGGGTADLDAAVAPPPSGWHMRDNLFKYHASCFWTHSTLEGVAELLHSGAVTADGVERVDIHVDEVQLGTCVIPEPGTALEVKFSIAHLAAMALLGRPTTVISDADAHDREVIALRSKVALVADGTTPLATRVDVTHGGEVQSAERDVSIPERDLERQSRRLAEKFRLLASPVLGDHRAGELLAATLGLRAERRVRELMAAAARSAGAVRRHATR